MEETVAEVATASDQQPRVSRPWLSLGLTLIVAGLVLGLFDLISSSSSVASRGIVAQRPPIYGRWRPSFTKWGLLAVAMALIGAGLAVIIARRTKVKTHWFLAGGTAYLLGFAATISYIGANSQRFLDPLLRSLGPAADYIADVPFVRTLGVRGFMHGYPRIIGDLISVHSRTHPPGPAVFQSYLARLSPHLLWPRALLMATISALVLVPTWFLTRRFGDERSARYAVLLLAVAPAPALFTFLSMDAVFATILTAAAAILVWGLGKNGKAWVAFIGGLILGLATVMTYATSFIAVFAVLFALTIRRPIRESIRLLALASVGGVIGVALLKGLLDFNLIASWHASVTRIPKVPLRSYPYWIFGNPAVWLTFAGLPIAAFALRELIRKRPAYLLALFTPLLVADLSRGVFPGETERIGLFAYPFIAAAAGIALARWERSSGRSRSWVVGVLVLIAALQAVLLQSLFYTYW